MGRFIASDIVVTSFPFDDLSASKNRPALVLGKAWPNAYLLVAITSQQKRVDHGALKIIDEHLSEGSLKRTSYIRLDVWFTADHSLLLRKLARLTPVAHHEVIDVLCRTLGSYAPDIVEK